MNQSLYQEMMIKSLNAYAQMLRLNIELGHDVNDEEILAFQNLILETLDNGATANSNIFGFTPLMLYATFNILDDRFENELSKGNDVILASTPLHGLSDSEQQHYIAPLINQSKVNALSCAASQGNNEIVARLLETNLFSKQEDYRYAIECATINNKPEIISLFAAHNLNLFILSDNLITPLTIACTLEHIDVVREILQINPDASLLKKGVRSALITAAQSSNEQLHQAFSHLVIFQQEKLCVAMFTNQINECENILYNEQYNNHNFLLIEHNNCYISLLSHCYERDIPGITNLFKAYLFKLPVNEQVNTLINTINELENISPNYIIELMPQLLKLTNENFMDINTLILPNTFKYGFDPKLWEIINTILIKSPLKTIKFSASNPTSYGEENNLHYKHAANLIANLLNNTTLIECNLNLFEVDIYLESKNTFICKPLNNIMELITKRNIKLSEAKSPLAKDNVFNNFASKINRLIDDFYIIRSISAEEEITLTHIQLRQQVYSLAEYAALTLWNKCPEIFQDETREEHKISLEKDENDITQTPPVVEEHETSLPRECEDILIDIANSFSI